MVLNLDSYKPFFFRPVTKSFSCLVPTKRTTASCLWDVWRLLENLSWKVVRGALEGERHIGLPWAFTTGSNDHFYACLLIHVYLINVCLCVGTSYLRFAFIIIQYEGQTSLVDVIICQKERSCFVWLIGCRQFSALWRTCFQERFHTSASTVVHAGWVWVCSSFLSRSPGSSSSLTHYSGACCSHGGAEAWEIQAERSCSEWQTVASAHAPVVKASSMANPKASGGGRWFLLFPRAGMGRQGELWTDNTAYPAPS